MFYPIQKEEKPQKLLYVRIGDYKVSKDYTPLVTTLGSCVAVVLYVPSEMGDYPVVSMSHYLLPFPYNKEELAKNPWKYGTRLIEEQIRYMVEEEKIPKRFLRAKMAGGATVHLFHEGSSFSNIGELNIIIGEEFLEKHRIPITGMDVGGKKGRSILFDPKTKRLEVHRFGEKKPFYI